MRHCVLYCGVSCNIPWPMPHLEESVYLWCAICQMVDFGLISLKLASDA